jgi:hypothetical protein
MVSDQQFQAMANALSLLQAKVANMGRDSAFAPSSQDPYVVPGPRDFYSYTQRATSLAAGTSTSLTYQIEADSYFYLNAFSYQADLALAAITESANIIPLITVVIFDSGSGRQLMANPVPFNCIGGYRGEPFRLAKPRRFAPTAQITATLANYSTATTYNISFCLSGFKVYAQQAIAVNGPVGA